VPTPVSTPQPTPVPTPTPTSTPIQEEPSTTNPTPVPTATPTPPVTPPQTSDSPATSDSTTSDEDDDSDDDERDNYSNWVFQYSWLRQWHYRFEKQNHWLNDQSPIYPKEDNKNNSPQTNDYQNNGKQSDDDQNDLTRSTDSFDVSPSILWVLAALSTLPMLFPFKGNILFQSKGNPLATTKVGKFEKYSELKNSVRNFFIKGLSSS
jgi:hypothetical protein